MWMAFKWITHCQPEYNTYFKCFVLAMGEQSLKPKGVGGVDSCLVEGAIILWITPQLVFSAISN